MIENSGIKFSAEARQNFLRVDIDEHSKIGPEIEAKISAEELQELLRFAIVEQHFFEFDSETAQRELAAEEAKTGLHMCVADGVTTMIHIRTAERDHKGKFYALYDYVTAFPTLKPLLNLYAIQDRLLRLFHEINAGGKERATVTLANEYLQRTYPNIPPLVLEDFLYVNYRPDGRTLCFVPRPALRKQPDHEDGFRKVIFGEAKFSVAVEYIKGGTPKIKVCNPPQ